PAYLTGSAPGASTTITYSHDGGGSYDALETVPVTHIRWQRTSPMSPGGSGTTSVTEAGPWRRAIQGGTEHEQQITRSGPRDVARPRGLGLGQHAHGRG